MKSLKINVSILILLFINFIFFYKYSSRYTEFAIHISTILLIFQFFVFKFSNKIIISNKQKNIICYGLFSFIVGLVIISYFAIPIESLNVDRWSVISSFLTEFFNRDYPYYAKSHMGNYPGPMPIYFLIASPFHLLGELSILSCLGFCILTVLLIKKVNVTENIKFLLFYMFTSLYLIWEITTRSNLFTFTILVLLVLNEFINLNNKNTLKFYGLALLTGLMLSTRSVYILPYIIFFLSSLINNEITFKKLFLFLSIALIAFISTFIPFMYFFYSDFFTMNPFIIQSSFLVPKFYTLIFMAISILFAFLVKNKTDKFFYSGLSLFIAILIYAIYHLFNYGYEVSYINSKIDISYFIFCIPFLIKYLMENNNKDEKITIANTK
jgi:hypothetical protein